MRIQWSSEEAQEMLRNLEMAASALGDCVGQAGLVRSAFSDANADGSDDALRSAGKRFEACAQRLRKLSESLDAYIAALHKADELFNEVEDSNNRLISETENGKSAYINDMASHIHSVNWDPSAFVVMPSMRTNAAVMPKWFEDITATAGNRPVLL